MVDDIEDKKVVKAFRVVAILLVILLSLSTLFFHKVEGWKWLDSIYYSVVTIATVGYGDFTPQTDLGKIGAMVLIVIGIGLFATFANLLLKRRYVGIKERKSKK